MTELIAQVASVCQAAARRALARRELEALRGPDALAAVAEAGQLLSAAELVPKREQAERLRLLLGRLNIAELDAAAVVELGRRFPPHLRAVVAEAVPPAVRPLLYNRRLASPAPVATPTAGAVGVQAAEPAPAVRPPSTAPGSTSPAAADSSAECRTALLLSSRDRQDANVKTLARAGFDPLIVESVHQLEDVLLQERGVCACVIDHSVLHTLDEAEQRSLMKRLGTYSTFLRVRIESRTENDGLKLSRDAVRQLLKGSRGFAVEVPQIAPCFDSDGNIAPSEVRDFETTRDLLRSHHDTRFIVGELTAAQAHVLVAAVRTHTMIEFGGVGEVVEVRTLTTTFLVGGKSGARLATVRVNEGRPTLVAKITSTSAALEEMERFRRFIQPWDPALRPELHFHREDAVILTGLVSNDRNRNEPAEPLEERITNLWNDQWFASESRADLVLRARDLARGLERAAQRLAELNAYPADAAAASDASAVQPMIKHVARLERDAFEAGLGDDAVTARDRAWERFRRLARAAVVHGDVHLRNILLRGESDIHLIDFAGSGPGHPAADLVRFEMALYTGAVRQFESEKECVAFQRALSVERVSVQVLEARFPRFFQCHVNRACAHGMVAAADHAIQLLRQYGGEPADYLAAKYLVAWQYVGIIGMHTGLARAVVEALRDEFLGV